VAQMILPSRAYKLFQVEAPGQADLPTVLRSNGEVCRFLAIMQERGPRFARLLVRGLPLEEPAALRFGGCYVAATGADPSRQQGFASGIFRRLLGDADQAIVEWSEDALREDRSANAWALRGYVLLGIVLLVLLGLVGWSMFGGTGRPKK